MDSEIALLHHQFTIGDVFCWERIAELGETVNLDTYGLVLNQNDSKQGFCYAVAEGFLAAKKLRHGRDSVTFCIMCPGSLLFEYHTLMGVNDKFVYYEALTPVVLKRVARDKMRQMIDANPKWVSTIMNSQYKKLIAFIDQLEDSNSRTAKERLLTLLQELTSAAPVERDGEWMGSHLKLSQQMMADLLCINRVTVAKALNALKEEGLILMDGRRILLSRKAFERTM